MKAGIRAPFKIGPDTLTSFLTTFDCFLDGDAQTGVTTNESATATAYSATHHAIAQTYLWEEEGCKPEAGWGSPSEPGGEEGQPVLQVL